MALRDTIRTLVLGLVRRSSRVLRATTRARPAARRRPAPRARPGDRPDAAHPAGSGPLAEAGAPYPGDVTGRPAISYSPHQDALADPGEVVWCWVPYQEDHSRGKDRPVLLVGRDGDWLLGVPLTSKDHHRDAAQEAHEHRFWVDVGTGAWDPRGRESQARVDRVVRVDPRRVRRTGAALDRARFDVVTRAVLAHAGR